MELPHSTDFLLGLLKIIWIDIILSGDNAVVIALAARSLPVEHQRKAVMLGAGAAVALRLSMTVVVSWLLLMPYLQIIGGLLLLWVGVQLLGENEESDSVHRNHGTTLFSAIRLILVADFVMSLDNVVAVAAASKGNLWLLLFGLALSIPLVVFSSTFMIRLMDRFPLIVTLGAVLIGWVAGETIAGDLLFKEMHWTHELHYAAAAAGATFVLVVGKYLQMRRDRAVPLSEKPEAQPYTSGSP